MPRTAILYARSHRRDQLDRQVRELEDWCDRAGVVPIDVPIDTVAEQLREIIAEHQHRIAISRDDADHF